MNVWIILLVMFSPVILLIYLIARDEYEYITRKRNKERDLRIKNLINKL